MVLGFDGRPRTGEGMMKPVLLVSAPCDMATGMLCERCPRFRNDPISRWAARLIETPVGAKF
jgi:hypothetical protein